MTHRNKRVLEELLAKIDAELAEKDAVAEKGECAEEHNPAVVEILSALGSSFDNFFYAPKYEVPKGCPPIDLEVRTNTTKTLYLIVNCKTGLNSLTLTRAANSLKLASTQAPKAHLCVYFMDDTIHNRIFVERHKKTFTKYGILTSFTSQPLLEPAGKYPK